MKKLHALAATIALTLLVGVSGSAGTMSTWKTQPTPTPAPTSVAAAESEAAAEGIMEAGVASADIVKEIAVNLLHGVLALF